MFITNRLNPGELLAHFLDLRGGAATETSEFANYKHNDDLCPRYQANIHALLATYNSYRMDVADIQGVTDDGVDVLVRYETAEGDRKRAGLQIKSHAEFEDWRPPTSRRSRIARGPSMVEKLLAQSSRAKADAQVDDYYIVLCTDAIAHRDRIRQITSAFKNHDDVKVVTPEKALPFFEMTPLRLTLQVTRLLCAGDPLLRSARAELAHLGPVQSRILVHLVRKAFEEEPIGSEERLIENVESLVDEHARRYPNKQNGVVEVMNDLEQRGIIHLDGSSYRIIITSLPVPLCALYFDQRHRRGRYGTELEDYLCDLILLE